MTIPKFRVYDKVKKCMSEVEAIVYTENKVYPFYSKVVRRYIPFKECVLMQSTGLKDVNDEEIFEGDVLQTYDGELAKVVWNKELGCWEAEFLSEIVDLSEVADVKSNRSDCEIVGNIYENPEFLEEEEWH